MKEATGLDLRVLAAGGTIDFARDHIDLAIRRSDFPLPPSVDTTTLAAERMGPVVRSDLAEAGGDTLPLLYSESRPDAWRTWSEAGGARYTGAAIRYQHFYLAIQAAEAGQGVAMASIHMVADAIASQLLAAPHGFLPDGTNYLAIWPADAIDPRRSRLIGWLKDRLTAPVA